MKIDTKRVAVEGKDPITVLQPFGDLDASNYEELIAEARRACDEGARQLVLDLSQVPYMSSSGLVAIQSVASLLRGAKLPELQSGWDALHQVDRDRDLGFQLHFRLCGPQPRVGRVLEIVGFDRFLAIHPDLEAALASF